MKSRTPARSLRRGTRPMDAFHPHMEALEGRLQPGDTFLSGLAAELVLTAPSFALLDRAEQTRAQEVEATDLSQAHVQAGNHDWLSSLLVRPDTDLPQLQTSSRPAMAPLPASTAVVPFAMPSQNGAAPGLLSKAAPDLVGALAAMPQSYQAGSARQAPPVPLLRTSAFPLSEEVEAVTATTGEEGVIVPDAEPANVRLVSHQRFERTGGPEAVTLEWSTYLGSFLPDTSSDVAVAGDSQYIVGAALGFDAITRAYVARFDANASIVELVGFEFTGSFINSAAAVAVDGAGNVYVAGDTDARFPGETTSAFALRLNADFQTVEWAFTYSGQAAAGNSASMHDIVVNAAGTQVWMTGGMNVTVSDRADRGLLLAHHNAVTGQQINGRWHRFASGGAFIPAGASEGLGLAVNAQGIPYVAGAFLDFSSADALTQAVCARFNTNLTLDRIRYFTNNGIDLATSVVLDSSSNPYLTGTFSRSDGSGISNLMLAKFNAANTSTTYGRSYFNPDDASLLGASITLNSSNQPILLGTIVAGEDSDALLYRMSTANPPAFLDGARLGGTTYDLGRGVAAGPAGAVYVTGLTASLDFPTTPGVVQEAPGGFGDAYLTKLTVA